MTTNSFRRLLYFSVLSGGVWAQGVQNSDAAAMFGPASVKAQTISGSNIAVPSSTGYAAELDYGYQLVRRSAASLWLDIALPVTLPGKIHVAGVPGSVDDTTQFFTAGGRFMAPLSSRVSIYAVTGGGIGGFHYPVATYGTSLMLKSTLTVHGVFDFGGGIDVRLTRHFSIRAEVRDFVTGAGLSGTEGHNHLVPVVGLALHH